MAFRGVLPEAQSFGTQLARGLGGGFGSGLNKATSSHAEMAQKLAGTNQNKQEEKLKTIETGLGTIERMRNLLPSAGPSNWIASLKQGDVTRERGELEALGRSLIPLVAAGVPIRNQREFDEYSKVITNPNSTQAKLEGALNGIEDILSRSSEGGQGTSQSDMKKKSVKFDSRNPEHKKKAEQLFKTYKDKEKVREILSREFEF